MDCRKLHMPPLPHGDGLTLTARTLEQPGEDLRRAAGRGAVAAEHRPAEIVERSGDPCPRESDHGADLPHSVFGRPHQTLAMAGTAAFRQHGDPVDDGRRHRASQDEDGTGHHLDMPYDAAGEPGHESVGGIVIGVVNGRMKLRLRRGCGQARKQLENLVLVAGSGGGDLAFLQHPGRGLERQHRVLRQVTDRRPLLGRTAADDRAGRANLDRDNLRSCGSL